MNQYLKLPAKHAYRLIGHGPLEQVVAKTLHHLGGKRFAVPGDRIY